MSEEIKILSVGNSFAIDTMYLLPQIAVSLGVKRMKIGILFVPGCSINRHWSHAEEDLAAYMYYFNDGSGWTKSEEYDTKISDAVKGEQWDVISIQHGSGDRSRYTSGESYENLPRLVEYIKSLASSQTRIAFNMAWVGDPQRKHHEILSYNGDTRLMYENLVKITRQVVGAVEGIDIIVPTGKAIELARSTELADLLLRDGFHLSREVGRYIAALTFLKCLTGMDIDSVTWAPEGIDDQARRLAIACADESLKTPL